MSRLRLLQLRGVSRPLAARSAIFWRASIPSLGRPILMPLAFARAHTGLRSFAYLLRLHLRHGRRKGGHRVVPSHGVLWPGTLGHA
jgi:hypothetical protein